MRKTVLRRLGGERSGELRAGRFFASPKVMVAKLIEGWADRTGAAVAGRHVLAVQDSNEVTMPTTAQRRSGLGPVGKGNAYGVLVHAMTAIDAVSGACLGLVGGDVWTRAGVNPIPHRRRLLEDRESVRWIDTAQQAKQVLQSAAMVTVVDDREADIHPKWAMLWVVSSRQCSGSAPSGASTSCTSTRHNCTVLGRLRSSSSRGRQISTSPNRNSSSPRNATGITTLAVLHIIRPSRGKAVAQNLFGAIQPMV